MLPAALTIVLHLAAPSYGMPATQETLDFVPVGVRYDLNPDHEFEYVTLREDARLCAVAVVWREAGRCMICEWISRRAAGPRLGRALVREVCAGSLRRGDDRVSFVGHDDGYFASCLGGFRMRLAPESVLTGRGLEDGPLDALVRDGQNWTVTYGDADYV